MISLAHQYFHPIFQFWLLSSLQLLFRLLVPAPYLLLSLILVVLSDLWPVRVWLFLLHPMIFRKKICLKDKVEKNHWKTYFMDFWFNIVILNTFRGVNFADRFWLWLWLLLCLWLWLWFYFCLYFGFFSIVLSLRIIDCCAVCTSSGCIKCTI